MCQNQKSNIKMINQNLKTLFKRYSLVIIVFFVFIWLAANIFSSQYVSPDYVGVVGNQKQSVISYLRKIKTWPKFMTELNNYKETYGDILEEEVFKIDRERKEKIGKLEEFLTKNNQARDVLYGLYILYKEEGDNSKATEYLNRAKEIDPTL